MRDNLKDIVYVLIPTFNHENYLSAAVEGVMNQIVDAEVRILIRDDASTDKTSLVAQELRNRFPDHISLILNSQNKYKLGGYALPDMLKFVVSKQDQMLGMSNLDNAPEGQTYIAICDGDDFWTNSNKLHTQLEVLRTDAGTSLVHTKVNFRIEHGGSEEYAHKLRTALDGFPKFRKVKTGEHFRDGHNVFPSTALFRLSEIDFEELANRPPGLLGDWVLFSLLTRVKKPRLIQETMATYRIHQESMWSSKTQGQRDEIFEKTKEYLYGLMDWK